MVALLWSQLSFYPGYPQPFGRFSPQKGKPTLLIIPQLNMLPQLGYKSSSHKDRGILMKINNMKIKETYKGDDERNHEIIS